MPRHTEPPPSGADIKENFLRENHREVLSLLLQDHSRTSPHQGNDEAAATGHNILWATDSYSTRGGGYQWGDEMTVEAITGRNGEVIRPRSLKSPQEQARRVKDKGEVFTPAWLCRRMTDYADRRLRADVKATGGDWRAYVRKTCLELTCGEAPFLVSRYDAVTGEVIPIGRRYGMLDRKLQAVAENTADKDEFALWALLSLGSVYGYEWQGDSLLLAREAVVATVADYWRERFPDAAVPEGLLLRVAEAASWNLWQMDGLRGVVPGTCRATMTTVYNDLFGEPERTVTPCPGCATGDIRLHNGVRCQLRLWTAENIFAGGHQRGPRNGAKRDFGLSQTPPLQENIKNYIDMKFDFIIGNPPYQEETKDTSDKPVYDKFMSGAYQVGSKVELITPARFLFNAGKTPKAWNEQMLNDPHLKVLKYEQDSSKVFRNTDIKGGVAVTYHDETKDFGAIGVFTVFPELNSIISKVLPHLGNKSLESLFYMQNKFDLEALYKDYPQYRDIIGSGGREKRLTASILYQLDVFKESKTDNTDVAILGVINNKRVYRYIPRKYLDTKKTNLLKWKVLVPKSNGTGAIGEVLSTPLVGKPLIGKPLVGYTQTFLGIGCFQTEAEAQAAYKYVCSKFARTMLGVLKITQDNPPEKWRYVPLQDFTEGSDIDWSRSVGEIDRQLYKKYGLAPEEIAFIEEKVRAME